MLTRRNFLTSVAAAAAATALPLPAAAVSPVAIAPAEPLLAFAYGTEGAFNWQPIFASSLEEATRLVREANGYVEGEYWPYDIERVKRWDKRQAPEHVTAADWIRAGMGHTCDRCSEELFSGGDPYPFVLGEEEVVCGECLTFTERVEHDRETLTEQLADKIADDGEEAALAWLEAEGATSLHPVWVAALALAEETGRRVRPSHQSWPEVGS